MRIFPPIVTPQNRGTQRSCPVYAVFVVYAVNCYELECYACYLQREGPVPEVFLIGSTAIFRYLLRISSDFLKDKRFLQDIV